MIYTSPALPPEFHRVIQAIEGLREQLRYSLQQQPRKWTGMLRRSVLARAIQASNSIEGIHATLDDALAAVDEAEPLDEKTQDWLALSGYRNAMSYVLQLADDPHYVHNTGTIRALHYMMVGFDGKASPGRWRPGSIFVVNEKTRERVYEGPDVELVPALMEELVQSMNSQSGAPVLVRAAMAHLNLAMIHPFRDGNGRMARALQTLMLARDRILDPNFSSIEEYLGRNQEEYYLVLAEVGRGAWHPESDALPWIRFILTAHYRQAEALQRRANEFSRLCENLLTNLKEKGLHERMLYALADAAVGHRVRNISYRQAAEISDEVAGKDLRSLADLGWIIAQGERRGRVYLASDWLQNIRHMTREHKIVTDPFTDQKVTISRQQTLPGLNSI